MWQVQNFKVYMVLCAIWYHLYNLHIFYVKNTHGLFNTRLFNSFMTDVPII